jgi:hypothetical protein
LRRYLYFLTTGDAVIQITIGTANPNLILNKMKKQIFIMMFLSLAFLFAGTNAFGQPGTTPDLDRLDAIPTYCPPALPLACGAGSALTPMPGIEYPYTITSSSVGTLHWFVTDDATIISTQGTIAAGIELADGSSPYVLSASANYNVTTNTSPTVNITWKSFDGVANNVLLVVYNVDDANCTDNMEVYRIIPQYAFTLDIAGIADDGTTGGPNIEDCVNPIQSAIYNGTTLTVDYGTDYVFFAVNAANWQTSWLPGDFAVKTDGGSTVTIDGWAYPANAATGGAWNTVGTDPVLASAYPAGVSNNGFVEEACIIVRVRVEHGIITENLVAETINLTVNGIMANPADGTHDGLYPDLEDGGTGQPCYDDLTTDNADFVLTPRPTVTEVTPDPFEPKVP